jgi:uncharacterized protein DUF2442
MIVWVEEARSQPAFRLWIRFSDRSRGIVDLKAFVQSDPRPIVRELLDPDRFSEISVRGDTVVWANGFDLAPEFLRERPDTNVAA